jgi:hypothetical protein
MMSGGTRFLTCLLRTLRKTEDKANSLIAGAFGGLSVVFFSSTELAMYFVGKALESLFYFGCEEVLGEGRDGDKRKERRQGKGGAGEGAEKE